jgi:hypothetical protein
MSSSSSPTPFLTEVPHNATPSPKKGGLPGIYKGGRDDGHIYAQRFESEDMTRKRNFLALWWDVTQEQKEARAEKESEMLALTRRNNFKMKTEVKG